MRCQASILGLDSRANKVSIMFDPVLVVAMVTCLFVFTGGIKISIGNINIGNKTNENDDN